MPSLLNITNSALTDKQYNSIAIYLVVTAVLSAISNLFGLLLLRNQISHRNPSVVPLLTSLAANIGVILLQSLAAASAFSHRWLWGSFGCQMYAAIMFELVALQLVSVPFIAFDRYIVTCRPSWSDWRTQKNYQKTVFILVWANGIWAMAPLFGWGSYAPIKSGIFCTINWNKSDPTYVSYLTAVFVFVFLLPFCVASALYNSIIQYLKRVTSADAIRRDREEMNDYQEISSDNAWAPKNHVGKVSLLCLLTTFVAYLTFGLVCLRPFDKQPMGIEFVPLLASKIAGVLNPIFHIWLNPGVFKRLFILSDPKKASISTESETLIKFETKKITSPQTGKGNRAYRTFDR